MRKAFEVKLRLDIDLDENLLSVSEEMHESDLEELLRDLIYDLDGVNVRGLWIDTLQAL